MRNCQQVGSVVHCGTLLPYLSRAFRALLGYIAIGLICANTVTTKPMLIQERSRETSTYIHNLRNRVAVMKRQILRLSRNVTRLAIQLNERPQSDLQSLNQNAKVKHPPIHLHSKSNIGSTLNGKWINLPKGGFPPDIRVVFSPGIDVLLNTNSSTCDVYWVRVWERTKAQIKLGFSAYPDSKMWYDNWLESHISHKSTVSSACRDMKMPKTCTSDPRHSKIINGRRGGTRPGKYKYNKNRKEKFLFRWLAGKNRMQGQLKPILQEKTRRHNNTAIVMVVNHGYLGLFLNFVSSALLGNISLEHLVVFAAEEHSYKTLICLGGDFTIVYDPNMLPDMPKEANKAYGDSAFLKMMWLKTASVWMILDMGFNVLFQDSDVVWFTDPLPLITSNTYNVMENKNPDTVWMDDSSRSERFAPFYANSGFFFLRHTPFTQMFWEQVQYSYDINLAWGSQQALINFHLETYCQYGLGVDILCPTVFAGGQFSTSDKKSPSELVKGGVATYHMHFTLNNTHKFQNFKKNNLYFLFGNENQKS